MPSSTILLSFLWVERDNYFQIVLFRFNAQKSYEIIDGLQCKNDEEIVAVIAHELGHWKLNHTMYSFIAVQVCCNFFCKSGSLFYLFCYNLECSTLITIFYPRYRS